MFGLEFRPSGSLLIRTTYSSAFKPILAYDAVRPAEIYPFPNSVRDPAFDGQEFPVQVLTGGGTPLDLKPETSTNITFGFVYAPNQSFRASLSAWRNEFNNKFEYLQLYQDQLIVDNESRYPERSEEHTSELQSLMRISYAVFCLKKKNNNNNTIL